MKKFLSMMIAACAAFSMIGCTLENLSIEGGNNNGGNVEVIANEGYLSISNLSVDCRIDERDPGVGVMSVPATRNSVDVNTFDCQIINEKNVVVTEFKFGERPTTPIALEAGDYILKVQSGEIPGAAWDAPVYGTSKAFKIVRNETTQLSQLVCSLMQIKVEITYAEDLYERLSTETCTTVSIGSNALDYTLSEVRSGFFTAPNVNNTINLHIVGAYAADKVNFKAVEMNKEVTGVKVGQYSKIHFYLENTSSGNITVGVTIRDWVTDEVIPCNVADSMEEDEYPEYPEPTEDPSIVWAGYDISKRYSLDEVASVDLLINASKGINGFLVQIKSETLTPDQLSTVGLCDVLNLCNPTQSYDSTNPGTYIDVEQPLRDLGFAVGEDVIGKTSVTLSITQFLGILKSVSKDGDRHDFVLTVTDAEGNKNIKTLKLQTGEVTPDPVDDPNIEWVGHDLSVREQIVNGLEVDLLITASKGIKEFYVEIQSAVLTPEELANTGLCNVLNICYPKQSYDSRNPEVYIDVEQPLRDLGFAVGEDVIGKNSVTLSISQFMGIFIAVSGNNFNTHDFIITVVDADGNKTVKTLMLQTGNK